MKANYEKPSMTIILLQFQSSLLAVSNVAGDWNWVDSDGEDPGDDR